MAVLLCIKSEKSRKGEVGGEGRKAGTLETLAGEKGERIQPGRRTARETDGSRRRARPSHVTLYGPPFCATRNSFRLLSVSFAADELTPPPLTFSPQQSEGAEGPQPFRISINRDIKRKKEKKKGKNPTHTSIPLPPFPSSPLLPS